MSYREPETHRLTNDQILDLFELRPSWHARAACHGKTDIMFPTAAEGNAKVTAAQIAEAKAICATCPVQAECAEWGPNAAITNGIDGGGVWGGMGKRERMRVRARTNTPQFVPKVTADDVRAIRARAAAGEPMRQLAREFGLHRTGIAEIVHRRTWKHVS